MINLINKYKLYQDIYASTMYYIVADIQSSNLDEILDTSLMLLS